MQNRREFMKAGGVATAALLAQGALPRPAQALPGLPSNPATAGAMPTRNLGRTGFRVGAFSLGGQSAIERGGNEAVAVPIVERALDLGVNYIDTSSIYGGPERWSERYIGQVMKRRRSEAFLASKTKERTRDASMRMLEQSLKLLNTDHLDLWQLHDIGTLTDVDEVFAKGGAMEALVEAREQKMVRFLGLTGHHRPDSLMDAIRRFPFDAALVALNAADRHHHSFMTELLPLARGEADGRHRHEDHGPRAAPLDLDPAAPRAAEALVGGGRDRRAARARSGCATRCTTRSRSRSAR